jgi:hypothetical protein
MMKKIRKMKKRIDTGKGEIYIWRVFKKMIDQLVLINSSFEIENLAGGMGPNPQNGSAQGFGKNERIQTFVFKGNQ